MELDKFLSESENIDLLCKGWKKAIADNPLRFFEKIIMPLLPKETLLKLSGGSDMGRGLVEAVAAVLNATDGEKGNGKPKDARPERSTSRDPSF